MSPGARHRLLVVDDDPRVREAYRTFFDHHPEFVVAGEARTAAEAVSAYGLLRPDLVLMDLELAGSSGIDATRDICARSAGACVVALTTFGTREYVVAALRAGASGYLLKGTAGPALVAALRQAMAGDMPLSSLVRRELVTTLRHERTSEPQPGPTLSPRERELVEWLAHGLTNQQIAVRMHLSEGSVKQYVARVATKLGVVSRTQVLVRSIQLGVIDPMRLPPVRDSSDR